VYTVYRLCLNALDLEKILLKRLKMSRSSGRVKVKKEAINCKPISERHAMFISNRIETAYDAFALAIERYCNRGT